MYRVGNAKTSNVTHQIRRNPENSEEKVELLARLNSTISVSESENSEKQPEDVQSGKRKSSFYGSTDASSGKKIPKNALTENGVTKDAQYGVINYNSILIEGLDDNNSDDYQGMSPQKRAAVKPPTFLQKHLSTFRAHTVSYLGFELAKAAAVGVSVYFITKSLLSSPNKDCPKYTLPDGLDFISCNPGTYNYFQALQVSLKDAEVEVENWKSIVSAGDSYMGTLSNSISDCKFQPGNCSIALMPTDLQKLYESGYALNKNSKALSSYIRNDVNKMINSTMEKVPKPA